MEKDYKDVVEKECLKHRAVSEEEAKMASGAEVRYQFWMEVDLFSPQSKQELKRFIGEGRDVDMSYGLILKLL